MSVITDKTFGDMLAALQKILRVNTVKSAAEPGKPFGAGNAACLDAFLAMAEDMGFETYNCDGYAGHVCHNCPHHAGCGGTVRAGRQNR